ncbi:hypothetical protein C8Q70DRAFT_939671 [Cubamyces menziesii]|nr:hypothetical protein C8Q70DRAFT_939671 [Cubamyces menziesii]
MSISAAIFFLTEHLAVAIRSPFPPDSGIMYPRAGWPLHDWIYSRFRHSAAALHRDRIGGGMESGEYRALDKEQYPMYTT